MIKCKQGEWTHVPAGAWFRSHRVGKYWRAALRILRCVVTGHSWGAEEATASQGIEFRFKTCGRCPTISLAAPLPRTRRDDLRQARWLLTGFGWAPK